MYPITYYSDILCFEEFDVFSLNKKNVVDFLIKKIDEGYYILIDLNYKKILDENSSAFWAHETMVYGYDKDNKYFFTPILRENTFSEYKVPFHIIEEAYDSILTYYKQDETRIFNRRTWFYGITLIKINNTYKNSNMIFDFISKLKFEMSGNVYTKQRCCDANNVSKYGTGIACVKMLAEILSTQYETLHESNDNIEKYIKSCLKLCENQKIILRSSIWIYEKIGNENMILKRLINEYSKCCELLTTTVLMFYKYRFSKNKKTLKRIIDNLLYIYEYEGSLLEGIIEQISNIYIKILNKNNQ